jgi:hypothetical protein
LCSSAGFTIEKNEFAEVSHCFESLVLFKEWLRNMSPYQKVVGKDNHDALVDDVAAAYMQLLPANPDGSVIYRDYLLYTVVKK